MKELSERLQNHPNIGEVRGMGMEIGVVIVSDKDARKSDIILADRIVHQALKNGLLLSLGDEGSIQLMPPLTTPQEDLGKGLSLFIKSLEEAVRT